MYIPDELTLERTDWLSLLRLLNPRGVCCCDAGIEMSREDYMMGHADGVYQMDMTGCVELTPFGAWLADQLINHQDACGPN